MHGNHATANANANATPSLIEPGVKYFFGGVLKE